MVSTKQLNDAIKWHHKWWCDKHGIVTGTGCEAPCGTIKYESPDGKIQTL